VGNVSNYLTDEMICGLEGAVGDSGLSVGNRQALWLALAEFREHRAAQARTLQPGQVAVDEVQLRDTFLALARSPLECCELLARFGLAEPEPKEAQP